MVYLTVLYPHPTDVQQFDKGYAKHIELLHDKTGIPATAKPYTVTKFLATPDGPATFYQLFSLPFETMEALQFAMQSEGMQAIGADATRISTGGVPVIMIGTPA